MTQTTRPFSQAGHDASCRLTTDELHAHVTRLLAADTKTLDAALQPSLAWAIASTGAQRGYVLVFSEDGQRFSCLLDHCVPGVDSIRSSMQGVPLGSFPWSMGRLKELAVVEVPNEAALPIEATAERTAMQASCIQSFVTLPLPGSGAPLGALGLDWLTSEGTWSRVELAHLSQLAQAMGALLDRERLLAQARQAEERLSSFIAGSADAIGCFEIPGGMPVDLEAEAQTTCFSKRALVAKCNAEFVGLMGAATARELEGRTVQDSHSGLLGWLEGVFPLLVERGYRARDLELSLATGPERRPRQLVADLFGVVDRGSLVRLWGIFKDVTQQRQDDRHRQTLENQLRQAQRLESIGLLAGGVAHDFNNMLVAVLNYAELALRTLHTNPTAAAEDLRAIVKAGERAAGLTRQLLAFSRQQPMHKQPINLNDVIRNLMKLLRRVIHESVDLDFVPGHALGTVLGDPGQIEQVMLNLVVNANDAIDDIGRVTIETENVVLNGNYVKTHPWARAGRYVLLSVSDTGSGMSEEVRERAFEPFFTTKGPERGSGLGLSTAYGIIKQHDGMIHVYSEPGMGSRFKIYLPIVERAALSVGGHVERLVRGGNETLLVAEDNDMVRQVVCALLERAGYQVIAAKDGGEAVQLFEQRGNEIHLALLDAVMPVMSGRAVFQHLHTLCPTLPVLFASGYTSGVFPEEFLREHQGRLIEKPYDSDTLLRRIREALDPPQGGEAGAAPTA